MSNQHNTTASPPWIAKKVWMLPIALFSALMAFMVFGQSPAAAQEGIIKIVKTANGSEVAGGGTVTFTLQVTSTVLLKEVTVTDNMCAGNLPLLSGDTGATPGKLDPSETWTYKCAIANATEGTLDNLATVLAKKDSDSSGVSDSDRLLIKVVHPGIDVEKVAVTNPVVQGNPSVFNITVRNTSPNDILLTKLFVDDALCDTPLVNKQLSTVAGVTGGVAGVLQKNVNYPVLTAQVASNTATFQCTVSNQADDFTNSVSVSGTTEAPATTVSDTDAESVVVLNPGLAITKSASKPTVLVTEAFTWTVTIYNTGQTNLGAPTVTETDPNCTLGAPNKTGGNADANLDPGEIWIYKCGTSRNTPGIFSNKADVSAGGQSASATAQVEVLKPGLKIVKNPPFQYVMKGDAATFEILVTNTSTNTALSNVVVTDLLCNGATPLTLVSGDVANIGKLDPDNPATAAYDGETWKYTCSIANIQEDKFNTASATAKDPLGNSVTPVASTAIVKMVNAGINTTKVVANPPVLIGSTAKFTITVTNNGTPVSNVDVTDAMCDAKPVLNAGASIGHADGILSQGDKFVYTCQKANVTGDFDNTAVATADDQTGKKSQRS